ncbi:Phosphatidylinositolglycan class N-domain-containing protein [Flammula alnicola]|nr:Phosphatidylinositolglycan class N-domain-containing protein [Flammula alnicola]
MPEARSTTHYNVSKLLLIGLAFHLIYIGSVFDCYFTSPVVHGMKSYGARDTGSPAKRLVLIIAPNLCSSIGDGLRADLLFSVNAFPEIPGSPEIVAPHLRSIVETRGAFGISHTRVPTESRPGHVAIIGGMYEDVSAVTKGWKTNPVNFDSVFNQSRTTFSFGSPDILPMFSKGATPGKDFTKDATALDVWVLDHLKTLFNNATTNPALAAELHSDKVVFFLHLLGLDTTGHSYRPHSKEYMENIQVVDNIVRETEELMSAFYDDNDTSFIFTADHGMSAIGNHGDGHPDNTRTPLIAWGSGVRGPLRDSIPSSHDAYSESWQLSHLFRRDVEQADIASLMAALSDLPGLHGGEALAQAAFVNAKVILEQYRVKHELKQKHTLFYTPFRPLTDVSTTDEAPEIIAIERLIAEQKWDSSRQASSELIQQSLKGLHYLQTYDRFLIRGFVTAAYLGWAAYASLHILRPLDIIYSAHGTPTTISSVTICSWIILVAFWVSFAVQKAPWSFYVYIAFPCYFWEQFLAQVMAYANMIGGFAILLTGLIGALCVLKDVKYERKHRMLSILFLVQAAFVCITMLITSSSVRNLQAKQGLPALNQWTGWVVLVVSSALPFVFRSDVHTKYSKILMYFFGFGPCFVILSISVEGLFFVAYSVTLIAWIQVERLVRPPASHNPTTPHSPKENGAVKWDLLQSVVYKFKVDDLRIALFFLFFVQVGFFGTGKSFYLAPVYRLIPIFNPFYMSTLLVFKIVAPYIMLSVAFAVLNDALNLPPFSLLLVALTLTDGMTLTFFYKVQDTGSWLEIGQSISFFCITSLLLLWSAGICAAGEYLMADVISAESLPRSRKIK